jgi:hypothetical protein
MKRRISSFGFDQRLIDEKDLDKVAKNLDAAWRDANRNATAWKVGRRLGNLEVMESPWRFPEPNQLS